MQFGVSRKEFEQWLIGLWLIWKATCAEKHKKKRWQWNDLQQECENYCNAYAEAKQQAAIQANVLPNVGNSSWKRPKRGRFRLDVDYATMGRSGNGGVGAIVRDHNDNIIFAMAKPVAVSATILHGELKALMHGICQCIEENISPVEVFSDSLLAVMAVGEENEVKSVLCEEFFDFFDMVKNLIVISMDHVRREANLAAHELAKFARNLETTSVWHDCWPLWLLKIAHEDST